MTRAAVAIDLGTRRTGFAVTDGLRIACQPLATYSGEDEQGLLEHVAGLLEERDVGAFVLGLPLNMDGSEGPRAAATRAFARKLLERFPRVALALQDERLTTKAAEERLRETERRWQDRKRLRDSMSAVILLEDWIAAGEPLETAAP